MNRSRISETSRAESPNVFPLAGKVTIDGQPPQFARPLRLVVCSTIVKSGVRAKDISANAMTMENLPSGLIRRQDGVRQAPMSSRSPYSKLTPQGLSARISSRICTTILIRMLIVPEFKIVHQPPGKTDCVFDLKVAEQAPVEPPGPNALTELRPPGK